MGGSKLDSNQIIKFVYDESTQSLRTIPSNSTSFSIELDANDGDSVEVRSKSIDNTLLLESIDASSDVNSNNIDILNYRNFSIMISYSSLTGTLDGVIKLQASNDGVIYSDINGETHNLSSSDGNHLFNVSNANYKYVRCNYIHNNIASGSISASYVVKG